GRRVCLRVEQGTLCVGPEQGMMRMLAMNVGKRLTRFAQLREGHGHTVYPRARSSAGIDYPPQQHGIVIDGYVLGSKPPREPPLWREVELRHDVGPVLAHTNRRGIAPTAKSQAKRIEQDGLARPGFPGERAESGQEFEF